MDKGILACYLSPCSTCAPASQENILKNGKIDRFYCSDYLRAKETAALFDIPDATWFTEFYLRERRLDGCFLNFSS